MQLLNYLMYTRRKRVRSAKVDKPLKKVKLTRDLIKMVTRNNYKKFRKVKRSRSLAKMLLR